MKKLVLKKIQRTLLSVAKFSATTPSQLTMYQFKCPKKLKK